jgi:hypothetical protein
MLVGLGAMAIFGFGAVTGLSFELTPEDQERKDYHWAWVNSRRWSGMFCKYVGVPLGALVFVFGAVASLIDLFV